MSSVVVEYPEGLPAPTTGSVTITERRKGSTIGGRKNFRTFQRDRHGQRTIAFTFTPAQSAIFREWWAEWLKLGGGWFAAEWPLPWTRGPSVFRFQDPPQWALLGGTLTGQGYWRVTATVEIRGRGMLPTMEVLYLTSKPYPIEYSETLEMQSDAEFPPGMPYYMDAMVMVSESIPSARNVYVGIEIPLDALNLSSTVDISARQPLVSITIPTEALNIASDSSYSARHALITYTMPTEALQLSIGVEINVK